MVWTSHQLWRATKGTARLTWKGITFVGTPILRGVKKVSTHSWNGICRAPIVLNSYILSPLGRAFARFLDLTLGNVVFLLGTYIILPLYNRAIFPLLRLLWYNPISNLVKRILAWPFVTAIDFFTHERGVNTLGFIGDIIPGELVIKAARNYVILRDNTQYSIYIKNTRPSPAHCSVTIDGEDMGTFVIDGHSAYTIERPITTNRKFTFRLQPNDNIAQDYSDDGGKGSIVELKFMPLRPRASKLASRRKRKLDVSKKKQSKASDTNNETTRDDEEDDLVSGKTVLTGYSNQVVWHAGAVVNDEVQPILITFRLVGHKLKTN